MLAKEQLELESLRKVAEHPAHRSGSRIGMLDGLRGLALIAVILYHVAPTRVKGGFLGVEAFFVLSGYLLTSLLLEEAGRTGRIDRKAYANRRFRRIGPALVVLLLGLLVLGPLVAPEDVYRLRGDAISSVLGLTNWRLILDGSSYFGQVGRPPLVRHLWSIAAEIQFYLLCPFVVAWILRRKRFTAIASITAGIAASALLMHALYASPDPSRAYYGSDTRASAMLAGMLLAVLLGYRLTLPPDPEPGRWLQRFGISSMALLGLMIFLADERSRFMYPGGFLITQISTMLVIAAGLRAGPVASFLDRRWLRWLGERCYGIYLWHWPLVALLRPGIDVQLPEPLIALLTVAIAVALGALSYRLIERPAMRRRRPRHAAPSNLHPVLRPAAACLAISPVVLLAIRLPTTNPIAESLKEGQRVVARQASLLHSGHAPLLVIPVVPQAAPSAGPEPPGALGRVTAIGDSVMVGAAGALQEKLGPAGLIDAKLSRQFGEGIKIAGAWKQQGTVGNVAIVHLGNNGPIKGSQVDALMAELSGARNVLLVNVRVGRPWAGEVNQTLKDAAARYPSARLVDWFAFSAGHPEWFHSDGNHLKPGGARAYAELIGGVLSSLPPPAPPAPAEPPTIILGG